MKRRSWWRILTGAWLVCYAVVPLSPLSAPAQSQAPTSKSQATIGATCSLQFGSSTSSVMQRLAQADQFQRQGALEQSESIRRTLKPAFQSGGQTGVLPAYSDPDKLSSAGRVYWREAEAGWSQKLESKLFVPLQLLTENYPDFIPAHLLLAQACQEDPQACQRSAQKSTTYPKDIDAVYERATALYPDNLELLDAKLKYLAKTEQWLQASIAARQFALTFPDNPKASHLSELADGFMQAYRVAVARNLQGIAIGNAFISRLTGSSSGKQLLSLILQGESAFGQMQAEAYKKELPMLDDPKVQEYINTLGQKLVKLVGRDDFNYEFYVVKDDSLNAFALPGGKVFVNTGAIANTCTEAELAGLLAHEISHAALSHQFQRLVEFTTLSNFAQILPGGELFRDLALDQYRPEQEKQSDILGTRILANAGYAADGLRNLMVTLTKIDGGAPRQWMATHPASSERVSYLEDLIQRNSYNRYAYDGVISHNQIQNRVQQLLAGQTPTDVSAIAFTSSSSQPLAPATKPSSQKKPSTANSRSSQPTAKRRTVGDIALNLTQNRGDVSVRIEGAKVGTSGSYTLKVAIENRSDRPFIFIPSFVKVFDPSGKRVPAKFSLVDTTVGSLNSGESLRGEVLVAGKRWTDNGQQNLILVVTESTGGGRVFRVPF